MVTPRRGRIAVVLSLLIALGAFSPSPASAAGRWAFYIMGVGWSAVYGSNSACEEGRSNYHKKHPNADTDACVSQGS